MSNIENMTFEKVEDDTGDLANKITLYRSTNQHDRTAISNILVGLWREKSKGTTKKSLLATYSSLISSAVQDSV